MLSKSYLFVYFVVFSFPVFIATTPHVGGVLYVLLFLCGVIFGWLSWSDLESWEKRTLIGFILFCFFIALSFVNNQNLDVGIKRYTHYLHFVFYIPMYFLIKRYKLEVGRVFLYGVLLASVVMFGQALYQTVVLGWERALGSYHPIVFGDVAMWCAVIIICAVITIPKAARYNAIAIGCFGLAIIASLMSASRGAWVLVPIISVWLLWIRRKEIGPIPLLAISTITIVLIISVLSSEKITLRVNVAIHEYQTYLDDPSKVTSIGSRLEMWRDSVEIWKEHPLIGTGVGDFSDDRLAFVNEGVSFVKTKYRHAHSIYFDVLATAGLIGLLSMLIFMLYLPYRMFSQLYKTETDPWIQFYALSGMAIIISFAVFGLTEGWLARNTLLRVYLMSILVFMSSIAIRRSRVDGLEN